MEQQTIWFFVAIIGFIVFFFVGMLLIDRQERRQKEGSISVSYEKRGNLFARIARYTALAGLLISLSGILAYLFFTHSFLEQIIK